MKKFIGYNFKRVNGLDRPICEKMPEVKKIKFTDREIGGVTYRVWSAFTDEINAADNLKNLMLGRLESDEDKEQDEQEEPTLKM